MNLRVGEAIITGRLEAAERLAIEGSKLGHLGGQREATWASVTQQFLIRMEQGRIDDEVSGALDEVADGLHQSRWPSEHHRRRRGAGGSGTWPYRRGSSRLRPNPGAAADR